MPLWRTIRRKIASVDEQISTSVQQTMEDVMLMQSALTMMATSRVPVYLDTPEMDSTVQVSHLTFTFTHINYVFVSVSAIEESVRRKFFLYISWLNSKSDSRLEKYKACKTN